MRSAGTVAVEAEAVDAGAGAVRPASGRMARLVVAGADLVADVSGALWWPAERALLVADLHLEKGSSGARRGVLLPPYDTRDTLARLAGAVARYRPRTVVALGDSLHDGGACERLANDDRAALGALQLGRTWVWVTGNHDPGPTIRLDGEIVSELYLGGLHLCHEPDAGAATGSVAGHLHPAARIEARGLHIRRRCFVTDGNRLVMPAFGSFTGGLNVLDAAFGMLGPSPGLRVLMLGQDGVYLVPSSLLRPD